MLHLIQFISLVLLAMLAGTLFGLGWATSKFSDKQFIQVLQGMLPPLEKWFPPLCLGNVAVLATLAVLECHHTYRFIAVIASMFSVLALIIITTKGNVPINVQLKAWDTQHLPTGWEVLFGKWKKYNNIRTVVICLGFLSLLTAVIY